MMINRLFKTSSLYCCSLIIVDNIIHKSFSNSIHEINLFTIGDNHTW